MTLDPPEALTWRQIHTVLWETIQALYEKKIVLEYTEHLSDYQLYCLILRDILPSHEKKLNNSPTYLHWHCLDPSDEPMTWLRYYASEEERNHWATETGDVPPDPEAVPFPRKMPRRAP